MEIRNIATFVRVAELQSFSRAAEQLGYSQSAVTVQIRQLEQELDVRLFERIGKQIRLTQQGEKFLTASLKVLKDMEQARLEVGNPDLPGGTIRIGTADSLFSNVLSPILLDYVRLLPGVETTIRTGSVTELYDMIRQNDVDLLFFLDHRVNYAEWNKVLERRENIIFVASAQHPLAGQKKISPEKLLEQPLLLTEKGVCYRYDLEQQLAERGLELHPCLTISNTDVIADMLLQSSGVSFLPEYVARKQLESGALVQLDVDLPEIEMWSQLVYHKNKWVTPHMQKLLDMLIEKIEV